MDIDYHIEGRIGFVISNNSPVGSDNSIRILTDAGFPVIVTVDDYDFNLSWKAGKEVTIRHFRCTFGDYPEVSGWELQHLNEFLLYEIAHGRNVAIWCRKPGIRMKISESTERFFRRSDENLFEFIRSKFETQAERAVGIPEKLRHCRACMDKGCITRLVCHVSSVTDAEEILKSGEILSASRARGEPGEVLAAEERNAAGDPPDYFDYVMFTFGNCTAGDRLVMERTLGRAPSVEELDEDFRPGVRFYFRYTDLVRHPGFRSDGYHYCKIRDCIRLGKLMLVAIAPESAREILQREISPGLRERLVFVDETGFPGLKVWSHQAYKLAERYI